MHTASIVQTNAQTEQQFLNHLRQATGPSHKALEDLPLSKSITQPNVSIAVYSNYLKHMFEVWKDVEQNIFPVVKEVIPQINSRAKTALFEKDFAALSVTNTSENQNPITETLSSISIPFALGILYVAEGSSLGGRFILKNIQATLGLNEHKGASYFTGYGEQTGSTWKSFLNAMNDYQAKHDCGDEIIEGAVFAFNAIHKYFEASTPV